MNDIYFYGKLKNQRDFIKSSNFSTSELDFWSSWFDRCSVSKNIPFFLTAKKNSKNWVFMCKFDHIYRMGAIAMSGDYSGRSYPFVIYLILSHGEVSNLVRNELYNKLKDLLIILQASLKRGHVVDLSQAQKEIDSNPLFQNLDNMESLFDTGNERIVSNWLEVSTLSTLHVNNSLTCSLYNKIFR